MDLHGKAAIVTGASSGIGRAIAQALGERGACVTLIARRRDRLEQVRAAIAAGGGKALVARADVCDEAALIAAFDQSHAHWRRTDILVNAAGVGRKAALREGDTADWRLMLEVNVLALAVATREALRRFDRETGGHIVHVSSMSGHRVPRGGGMYAGGKFAVRALAEALRCELRDAGDPTRVTCVSPGVTDTEFFEHYLAGDPEALRKHRSRYRMLDAGDVAAAVVHAVSAPDHVDIHDILMRSNEQPT